MNRQDFINYKQTELKQLNKTKLRLEQEFNQLDKCEGDFNDEQLDLYDYLVEQLDEINFEINRVNNLTLSLYKLMINDIRTELLIDEMR